MCYVQSLQFSNTATFALFDTLDSLANFDTPDNFDNLDHFNNLDNFEQF